MQPALLRTRGRLLSVIGLLAVAVAPVDAAEFMVAPGLTTQGQATASISVTDGWSRRWFESERGFLSGYWSLSATWWEAGRFGSDEQSLSISPVFVYRFNAGDWRPFVEFGIGAAYFTDRLVGDRNLGSRAHFEDRFGLGVQLSDRDALRLRVIH